MWPVVEREDPSTMEKYFVLKAECPDVTESRFAGFICMSLGIGKSWKQRQSTGMGIICLRLCSGAPQPLLFLDVSASQVTCVDLGILSFHRCIVSLI